MLLQYPYYAGSGRGLWQTLLDWGFLDALLPFILIFVLIFAILQKVEIFKEGDKPDRRINGILAMIISAMVVAPHIMGLYPPQSDPILIILQFLPTAAILLVAILMVIILLGLAGGTIPSLMLWAIALGALGILLFVILGAIIPDFIFRLAFLQDPSIQALIIILLVMGLVGYFITRDETTDEDKKGFGNFIKAWFGEIK